MANNDDWLPSLSKTMKSLTKRLVKKEQNEDLLPSDKSVQPTKLKKPAKPITPTGLEAKKPSSVSPTSATAKQTKASEATPKEEYQSWRDDFVAQATMETWSGVCWHDSVVWPRLPLQPTTENYVDLLRQKAAGWFLKADNKYFSLDNPSARLSMFDVETMLPQKLADHPMRNTISKKQAESIAEAVLQGSSDDPRLCIGVWSGKTYSLPGNLSSRLYRDYMWDINTWKEPDYRCRRAEPSYGAFLDFLKVAIPGDLERDVLLDWLAWSLQNESQKPAWAIFLYSEEKGTGKSTIGAVAEALFGAQNTAKIEGVDKIIATFNGQILTKKIVIAEEVKITSNSSAGNALKDLITGDSTTVDIKYQPMQSIDLKTCFLLTTNHRPNWLEGGERRYYIIHMGHDGNNQGEGYARFVPLVEAVMKQIKDPQSLAALYAALMERVPSKDFNPRSLNIQKLASPIMKELQADSQPESEAVLEALLDQYSVSILPSSDMKHLVTFLGLKNVQALRHALRRLGWEDRRIRWAGGPQTRVYVRKGIQIENGRAKSSHLAATLERASEGGYVWWPIEGLLKHSWEKLLAEKVAPNLRRDEPYSALNEGSQDGKDGPYLASKGVQSYWTWKNDGFSKGGVGHGSEAAGEAGDMGEDSVPDDLSLF